MIYLDYASTTPIRQEVLQAYEKILKTYYANADSLHQAGRKVQSLLETSRANIAQLFHVQPREIMFTSCASEANNYALKGFALANQQRGRHIITSCAEHSSIMSSAAQLQEVFGFEVTYLPLHADGTVHLEEVKKALRKDTILVSIMCVNNETGCINDIRTIANYVHAHSRAMVHSDLVQALGKMELDLSFLDMATFSAHKIFGLKGSGLLYHRANVELLPLISAGQQEDGLRGGNEQCADGDRVCEDAAAGAGGAGGAYRACAQDQRLCAQPACADPRDRHQFAAGGTALHPEFFLPVHRQ